MVNRTLSRLCVFLGARSGASPLYKDQARYLGRLLADQRIELVYGGGNVGLMGEVADACLEASGKVTGVIPKSLMDLEIEGKPVAHRGICRLEVVDSMHQRKARMADLADAFIALPGGYGTLEELFEVTTWAQLGFHNKPLGVLNTHGFYDLLLRHLDHLVQEGFLSPAQLDLLLISACPEHLLRCISKRLETQDTATPHLSDAGQL